MNSKDQINTMPALQFQMKLIKLFKSFIRGRRNPEGYWKKGGAIVLNQIPIPSLVSDKWVIVKTVYCGICGSDMKEITLNGARDNPIQSFVSFPHTIGHEIVGIIDQVGSAVRKVNIGDRVVINPWFSCEPRGISPKCSRCQKGDFNHCRNFQRGQLPTGMHLGITKGFGGYAPYVAVHESQCFVIPDGITFDKAILADPFAVTFHSCLLLNPKPDNLILVYGLGVLGLATVMCLKNIFKIKHVIAIGRYEFQKEQALQFGADQVFMGSAADLIKDIASTLNLELIKPKGGLIWAIDGVDGIIDTIGSVETFEVGMRVLTTKGRLIFTGVSTPHRCENTPHYFKELEIIGSCGAVVEDFQGKRSNAFQFFLEFLDEKLFDPSPLLTHKFLLEDYKNAFNTLVTKRDSQAIKVVFDFTLK